MTTTAIPRIQPVFTIPPILPGTVRVRIAPSPTGPLHLGTARTALFNFLFARKYKGVFVLRIEDTDLERSDRRFEKDIVDGLRWLGILWDEGIEVGGDYAPYRQSERTSLYAKHIEHLFAQDAVYWCFCSPQERERERKEQQIKKEPVRYSGKCALLPESEVRKKHAQGIPAIIRLRVPSRIISFIDLIRGPLSFDTSLFGDIAIAKGPSVSLYNLSAVIDDHEMAITHILRGEDHIANTPKQILIAEALGFVQPYFAHFPLILGPDRTKLSKRHGAISIQELKTAGYFPEAIVNFLVLLGWNPKQEQELFILSDLIDQFSLEGIQRGGAMWSQQKLEWFQKQFSKNTNLRWITSEIATATKEFIARLVELVQQHLGLTIKNKAWVEKQCAAIAPLVLERLDIKNLHMAFVQEFDFFFTAPLFPKTLLPWKNMSYAETKEALGFAFSLLQEKEEGAWNKETLEKNLFAKAEAWDDRGKFLWPLRVALSGKKYSPGPQEIAAILGKEETLQRIKAALSILDS